MTWTPYCQYTYLCFVDGTVQHAVSSIRTAKGGGRGNSLLRTFDDLMMISHCLRELIFDI